MLWLDLQFFLCLRHCSTNHSQAEVKSPVSVWPVCVRKPFHCHHCRLMVCLYDGIFFCALFTCLTAITIYVSTCNLERPISVLFKLSTEFRHLIASKSPSTRLKCCFSLSVSWNNPAHSGYVKSLFLFLLLSCVFVLLTLQSKWGINNVAHLRKWLKCWELKVG